MRILQYLVSKYKTPDANYPDGSAKDDVVAGDKTGTELAETWVNELLQACYALIRYVNDTPNNVLEKPGESQVVDSIQKWMIRNALMNFRDLQATGSALLKMAISKDAIYFVIVGNNGVILTSPDSEIWVVQTSGTIQTLNDIDYDEVHTKFLVVADNAVILTATDPTGTWVTETNHPLDQDLYGCDIAFDGLSYYVCGWDTLNNGSISLSLDQGVTWLSAVHSLAGSIGTTNILRSVIAQGGLLAVGDGGAIVKSIDAANWPLQVSGTVEDLFDIAYSPLEGGIHIAVGDNFTILRSVDAGITWSTILTGTSPNAFLSVNWIEEANMFIITGQSGFMFTSVNGLVWLLLTNTATTDLQDAVYSPRAGLAVVCGTTGNISQSDAIFPEGL